MVDVSGLDITPYENMEHAVNSILMKDGSVAWGFAIAINAEKIISLRQNIDVKEILKSATLRYPDGIGVVWALRRKGENCGRIPGCDLWVELMRVAGKRNIKVFLVGAKPEIMVKTVKRLTERYNVNLVGAEHGYFDDDELIIDRILTSGAEIVTVAMGSPAQEKFIAKCRKKHPNAFYMGVGGTYDVFVENIKRAPEWVQKYNMEWLYRAVKQPKRILRQVVLLEFFILLILNKL